MSFSFSPFFSISFCSSHIQFNLVSLLLIQFNLNCIVLSSRTFVYRLCFVRCFAPTRWSLQRRHFQNCNPRSRQIWQTSETFNFGALLLHIHEQILKVWHFNHPEIHPSRPVRPPSVRITHEQYCFFRYTRYFNNISI